MTDEQAMLCAIEAAREGIEAGQSPFGACIVRGNEILAAAHNAVWAQTDPSAHAEIRAIRQASQALNTIDLGDCTIYSTCEPCPMCFAAIHWARIGRVVYGASIADAEAGGFRELPISNEQMKTLSRSDIRITPGLLREPCAALFTQWKQRTDAKTY